MMGSSSPVLVQDLEEPLLRDKAVLLLVEVGNHHLDVSLCLIKLHFSVIDNKLFVA